MKRILLLDDEPSITFSLSRCLESAEVGVISCNDSIEARNAITNNEVDAIISDVQISPGNDRDSLEFINYVRQTNKYVPLITMSSTEDLKKEVMENGADYFFKKPVDIDELIELLRDLGIAIET